MILISLYCVLLVMAFIAPSIQANVTEAAFEEVFEKPFIVSSLLISGINTFLLCQGDGDFLTGFLGIVSGFGAVYIGTQPKSEHPNISLFCGAVSFITGTFSIFKCSSNRARNPDDGRKSFLLKACPFIIPCRDSRCMFGFETFIAF